MIDLEKDAVPRSESSRTGEGKRGLVLPTVVANPRLHLLRRPWLPPESLDGAVEIPLAKASLLSRLTFNVSAIASHCLTYTVAIPHDGDWVESATAGDGPLANGSHSRR